MATQQIQIFDFKDYKTYLNSILELRSKIAKGQRTKLAKFMGCQPAYLSQVLKDFNHLSPEQAILCNEFLAHTPTESRYFLNLVLLARAGNKTLKQYYEDELKQLRKDQHILKNRVKSNRTLSEADQARYYSSWHYAAVHVISSLPSIKTKEQIGRALSLPPKIVNETLEFLVNIGILRMIESEYHSGEVNLFLGSDSPFISKHHVNWRLKSLISLENNRNEDLHFSSIVTCSKADVFSIRERMVEAIQAIMATVTKSEGETMYAYTMDLFRVGEEIE